VHLDDDVLGAFHLKHARRIVAVVGDLGIREVAADGYIVVLRELHGVLEELQRSRGAGGVVRVVEEHQLGILRRIRGDRGEVGQEAVLRQQGHLDNIAARHQCVDLVDGVAGVGNQADVARVDHGPT